MSGWDDLVTTALLGTDRRPLPEALPEPMASLSAVLEESDPALRLLDLAAAYTIVARTQEATVPAPELRDVPQAEMVSAPPAAGRLLMELLAGGVYSLVNHWLVRCVDHGRVMSAEQWTTLLTAAARHRSIDRGSLARALGEQGRWFAGLNPEWAALHRGLVKAAVAVDDNGGAGPAEDVDVPEARQQLERILQTPQPWPSAVTRAGLGLCCREGRKAVTMTLLDRFSFGMPLSAYPMIGEAANFFLEEAQHDGPGHRTTAGQRAAHQILVHVESILHDRIRIDSAFGSRPYTGPRMIIHHPAGSQP